MAEKMTTLCKTLFGFFRKKKPYFRFYSMHPGVLELFPIVKSSTVVRNFSNKNLYQQLPTSNCPGLTKISSTGYVVTAPADFIITTNGDGCSFEWQEPIIFSKGVPGSESYVSSHSIEQTLPLLDDIDDTLKTTIKIETPWRVHASDDVIFLQLPVVYNNENRFSAAIGIFDPKFTSSINIQLFWKRLNSKELVRAGTPLCQMIPIMRKDLNINEYECSIENANSYDIQREMSYNYAANCTILKYDAFAVRLKRASKILKIFKGKK
jgi:hypothetical protein